MMSFSNSSVSEPQFIDPAQCRAEFIGAVGLPRKPMTITIEENEAKQAEYQRQRAEWRRHARTIEVGQ